MNPMDADYITSGTATPSGADTPSNQVSPPPSYHDIPGTVPAHQGVSRGPPPSYEEAVDPNGKFLVKCETYELPKHKIFFDLSFKILIFTYIIQ